MTTNRVIDVHAHVTPHRFVRAVANGDSWHGMSGELGELWNDRNHWNVDQRLAEMDELKVDMQLLSPTIDFYQYEKDAAVTAVIAEETNDEIAEMVRDHPDRFMGLGTLPMQDIDRALAEMARGMKDLNLKGFEINDQVNGAMYDEPQFDPFWQAVEDLNAFVLVHQYRDSCVALRTKNYFLWNSIGNLVERALTFGTLVHGGVMDKYPSLTICLCHAGGYTAFGIDRMDKGWHQRPEAREHTQNPPSTYLDRFFYDSCTYEARTLRFLVDVVGADRVLFGTDWPAPMMVDDPVRFIEGMSELTDEEKEKILRANASALFDG